MYGKKSSESSVVGEFESVISINFFLNVKSSLNIKEKENSFSIKKKKLEKSAGDVHKERSIKPIAHNFYFNYFITLYFSIKRKYNEERSFIKVRK